MMKRKVKKMSQVNHKYKIKIVEDMHDEYLENMFTDYDTVYVKPGVYAMSTRKLESLVKIAELQRYYQCNPVRFISDFFGIELARLGPLHRETARVEALVHFVRRRRKSARVQRRIVRHRRHCRARV